MNSLERIWVDKRFKRKLQQKAFDNGMSLAKLTKKIADLDDPLKEIIDTRKNQRGKLFDFKI